MVVFLTLLCLPSLLINSKHLLISRVASLHGSSEVDLRTLNLLICWALVKHHRFPVEVDAVVHAQHVIAIVT